ncbi:hypothetical protein [Shewanella gelidii]|uniref:Lipoprotein n=1 Tax=Shewanella gelidii TaxID=1642821 RepID=A0A917N725_9GAMM|nr:hypothetical protein [Shewanella gelidii]MCL1096822.1 hypothetical protein [Shewanella gelidii]GGI70412.1 hypothetical protein GCM10009332_04600 [Shewanella gelidii]
MSIQKCTVFLIVPFAISGCLSSTESDNIDNNALWASIKIEDRNAGPTAKVTAELNVGGFSGTNVELSDGEKLEVTVNGETSELKHDTDFLDIDYQTHVQVTREVTLFTIDFYRNGEPDILGSNVELPLAFDIVEPEEEQRIFSDTPLSVQWNSALSDSEMKVNVSVSCGTSTGGTVALAKDFMTADDGNYNVNLNTAFLNEIQDLDREQSCDVEVELLRRSEGSLADGYGEGGEIVALRARKVDEITLVINN